MRSSNFATRRRRPVGAVGAVIWALALACLGLLFVALSDISRLRDEVAQLTDHSDRLDAQAAELTGLAEGAPDVAALRAQSEKVSFFNTLTGPRHMPLTELLALLEAKLPRDVWVSQLVYSIETGRVSLSLRTDTDTALSAALRTLEGESALRNVILERQVRLQQGGRQLAQYDIEAVTR